MLAAVLFFSTVTGCEERVLEETEMFEQAEERFARGDYDGARVLYEDFLDLHPLSPLTDIAEQRLRTMERELDAVMSRRGAPAPVRVNPWGSAAATGDEAVPVYVDAPELPTLGE